MIPSTRKFQKQGLGTKSNPKLLITAHVDINTNITFTCPDCLYKLGT